ncbi:MFS transporter [Streptomyces luomodiensis]|uniref:MFS transporter n=1 Tax=Streptomyces luomodiensis TaxID=3026192 RepID=A0ABY9V8V6_9ACTN|nr:MFS transporter [Streptomyces sp. SCA4-21]WNF01214.1 MFS transporter [Streptomyces sp. SCA4-21]
MSLSRPEHAARPRKALYLTALLVVTNFLVVFDGLVVTVALPTVQRGFGMSQVGAQWVMTAYMLPLGGMLLLGGRCGDRYGRRRVLTTGLGLFTVGLMLAGLAPTPWLLLVSRALQGVGAALAVPTSFATISSRPDAGDRDRMFAAVAVAGGLGAAGGAVVGGAVIQGLGWRYVFLLSVPVAACAFLSAPKLLPGHRPRGHPDGLDLPGAALSVAGLMILVYGIAGVEHAGLASPVVLGSLAGSVLVFLMFISHERKAAAPLIRPEVLRVPSFRTSALAMPANEFSYQGTVFIGLLFFQQALGYSPLAAGLAFCPLGIVVLAGSPLTKLLLRRYHWTIIASCAQFLSACGFVLLALASPSARYVPHILPGLLILGLGTVVGAVTFNIAAGKDLSANEKGVGYGLFETAKYVAGVLAIACLGSIAAARTAHMDAADQATALAAGYRLAFLVAAGIAVLGGLVTVLLGGDQKGFAHERPGTVRASRSRRNVS